MTHTCLACGTTSDDVRMTVVDLEAEGTKTPDQRVIDVALPSSTDQRGRVTGFDYVQARERYVNEPRCRDKAACRARVRAMESPKPPPADAAEEGPSWMHS